MATVVTLADGFDEEAPSRWIRATPASLARKTRHMRRTWTPNMEEQWESAQSACSSPALEARAGDNSVVPWCRSKSDKSGVHAVSDASGSRSPPIRLRMRSHDSFAHRSMTVEWDNAVGERQRWSSYHHPTCSWFEADKVLPASVSNILVMFQVHTAMSSKDVKRVERNNACTFFVDPSGEKVPEMFGFQCGSNIQALDVTFLMRGWPKTCHVWKVWNAARVSLAPEPWEWWPETPRPLPGKTLEVLLAAEVVKPEPLDDVSHPFVRYALATRRLVSAAKALQVARRVTLAKLYGIDARFTGQWLAVNSGNTVGAGLAVASAACLFVAPPVGVGLGIGSVAVSGAATGGDLLADSSFVSDLRECFCEDDMNAFAVVDLQNDWVKAQEGAAALQAAAKKTEWNSVVHYLTCYGVKSVQVGLVVANTAAVVADSVVSGSLAAESISLTARVAPVAARFLGIAGAVVSTGAALHAWATTKSLQAAVRERIRDVSIGVLSTQRWLSAMDELECSICLEKIRLSDEVRCCQDSWHYSHALCIQQWSSQCADSQRELSCPLCCRAVSSQTGRLQDLIQEYVNNLHPDTTVEPQSQH